MHCYARCRSSAFGTIPASEAQRLDRATPVQAIYGFTYAAGHRQLLWALAVGKALAPEHPAGDDRT